MKSKNYTGIRIDFYKYMDVIFDETHRIYQPKEGAVPYMQIESEGLLAGSPGNAEAVVLDPLPDEENNFIVTLNYAIEARKQGIGQGRLFIIEDPVFSSEGKVIGCLSTTKVY